ncbi:uncharacterized protein LOC128194406 [Vigna angularis]|uniref:uncharacterized protein LOC128194406 n=1 Tax=Phaseolus angularis TaxID=3914 RepID=UPI0022B5E118|nr:uncharacterized protein LOC128194406 [Vigna angularis]
MEEGFSHGSAPIILGRPFMKTARTKTDVYAGTLSMEFADIVVHFNILDAMKFLVEDHSLFRIDALDDIIDEFVVDDFHSVHEKKHYFLSSLHSCIESGFESGFENDVDNVVDFDKDCDVQDIDAMHDIDDVVDISVMDIDLDCDEMSVLPLPVHSLESECINHVAESTLESNLQAPTLELKHLPNNLKYVYLEDDEKKPVIISTFLDSVQEEKLLGVLRKHKKAIGLSLADIPDSQWVSPIHVVPKKIGLTVVKNERGELIPARVQNSWRVCIDYRRLNQATRKDHFPLPFIEQMLERLANSLEKVLKRCIETNLVLNFEKCHFMVEQGLVLGHMISEKGIEVDPAKISVISQLPYPSCVREVRSFLGHAGFDRRFIKDFSKKALLLSRLLQKDIDFAFNDRCKQAFDCLKEALTTTLIIQAPDWTAPFELMCDASNYALGAVLTQKIDKLPRVIYYASRTLDAAQANYTTIEKELLIKDRSGAQNLVADHLSRIERAGNEVDVLPIQDDFPDETSRAQIAKIKSDAKYYVWDDPYMWKLCSDQVTRRCIPDHEIDSVLQFCHASSPGGHLGIQRTTHRVLDYGFYWPSIFKDAERICSTCEPCQRAGGSISQRQEMPQQPMLFCEVFDVWGLKVPRAIVSD